MKIISITEDEELIEQITSVYCNVFDTHDSKMIKEKIIRLMGYEGFKGLAVVNEFKDIICFSYGYTSLDGQYYRNLLKQALLPDQIQLWLDDCFEYVELAVQPNFRLKGLGTILHNNLLSNIKNKTSVLTTQVNNSVARLLYKKLGWADVKEPFYPSQDEIPFVIMRKFLYQDH